MITITMRLLCYRHRHHHENSLLLPFACASWLFINMCFAVSGVAQSDSKFIESVHSTDTWYISAGIFDFPAQLQVQESNLLCCPRPTSENMHLNQQFIFGMLCFRFPKRNIGVWSKKGCVGSAFFGTPGTRAGRFGHFLIHQDYYGDNLFTARPHSTRGWTQSSHFGLQSQIFRSGPEAAKLGHCPPGPNSALISEGTGGRAFQQKGRH